MRVYAEVARHAFRRYSTYRAATAAGVFTNTVFGFIKASVLIALWHARPALGGYDVRDAVTFTFVVQGLLAALAVFGPGLEVNDRIRTGDVVVDLYRPADFQAWWLANDLGRAGFEVIFRGVPPFLVAWIFFPLRFPHPGWLWAPFAACVLLGMLVSFALRYIVSLAGFWLLDSRGLGSLHLVSAMFFSGGVIPLVLFPGALGALARALPWSAMIQVPVDVFLGKHTGSALAQVMGFQLGWVAVLLLAGRWLTTAARRRVVAQGG